MPVELSLDMTLSREEFLRLLPGAVGLAAVPDTGGDRFTGCVDGRRWTLCLVPQPDLRLGSVVLPRHRAEIRLEGFSEEEAAAFLARFHRGFQRGGG
jgi:hypothetical protein